MEREVKIAWTAFALMVLAVSVLIYPMTYNYLFPPNMPPMLFTITLVPGDEPPPIIMLRDAVITSEKISNQEAIFTFSKDTLGFLLHVHIIIQLLQLTISMPLSLLLLQHIILAGHQLYF